MLNTTIGFIGSGNMATSLIGGLIAAEFDPKKIWVSSPEKEQLLALEKKFPIHTSADNKTIVENAKIVVLCVKPNVVKEVAHEIATTIQQKNPLIISIAAGIREKDIQQWLQKEVAIVRCMPNTPALIQCGATALYANAQVSHEQRELAESILRSVGITVWVDSEKLLDVVTALSGSGPAYFFLLLEALEEAAIKLGLPQETARLLTLQTSLGAARMALESEFTPQILRQQVTSPGGTTEQAIRVLEEENLRDLFHKAVKAATIRAKEIADSLGENN